MQSLTNFSEIIIDFIIADLQNQIAKSQLEKKNVFQQPVVKNVLPLPAFAEITTYLFNQSKQKLPF